MKDIISDIRKKQDELILMVNTTFEEIIREVRNLSQATFLEDNNEFESFYPLTNTSTFKGKKIIAIILNNERIITPTWKYAFKFIMEDVIKDNSKLDKLYKLRSRILGKVRTRVAEKSDGMRSPLSLRDDLFIETHYDTETLMNFLLQLLNEVSYDYSNIKVVIKN